MKSLAAAMVAGAFSLAICMSFAATDTLDGTGSVSGTVVAEQPFQAAKVYLTNADRHMTYMVYTNGGQYRAINLFPGSYEITVEAPGLIAGPRQLDIESGEAATVDLTLRDVSGEGPAAGSRPAAQNITLANYDEVYPPEPARETLERTCMTCHGVNWVAQRSGLDEAGWNALIDLMLGLDDSVWGVDTGTPLLPEDIVITEEQRAELVSYLARHFGPGTSARMVRNDESLPMDEAELGKAMWVEYTVPEPKAENGSHRWIQEPYFDLHGDVWYTERTRGAPAILRLDPRTAAFESFPLPNPGWNPHGIVVDPFDGSVWWAGRGVDVARLDPDTGETTAYGDTSSPQRWGGHTPAFDSKGNLWYTMIAADRLGKWDRETDSVSHWDIPTRGGRPYGILVDRDDVVWFANFHNCRVTRFDPVTEEFTEFVSPSNPCTLRRLGVDSNGTIWYGAFSTGMLGKLDPESGEMTEYRIGRLSEPYEAWVDPDDKIWMADGGQGGMLVRFDPQTERFTYYSSPTHSDMPKMAITRDGAVWYANRSIASSAQAPASVGVLYPDVDRMNTYGAYYEVKGGRAVGSGSPAPQR